MGRPPKARQPAEIDVLDPQPGEDSAIARILAAIGAADDPNQLRINVSRHAPGNRYGPKFNYCFSSASEEAADLLDMIKERCGGGIFRVRIVKADGTFVTSQDLAIEGEAILPKPETIAPALPALPVPTTGLEATLQAFMTASAENQRQLIVALSGRSADPIDLFKQFAAITAGLRSSNAEASGSGMVETIRAAMNLAREMNNGGGGGESTNAWDVVKTVLENPGILDGLKAIAQNMQASGVSLERQSQRPAIAAAPGPPIPQPAPAAAEVPAPAQPPTPQQMLDTYVPLLIQKAQVNANPALYAEFLLDNLTPDLARAMCYQPDVISVLTTRFPEIESCRQWFNKLLDELKAMIQDTGAEGAGDEPSPPANGQARVNP